MAAFLTSFLLPVLGIMLVTSEWSQRTAMVTFALEPPAAGDRGEAVVGLLLTLATVAVAIVIGAVQRLYAAAQGEATGLRLSVFCSSCSSSSWPCSRGFAFAALLLNTPAAIVVFFVYMGAAEPLRSSAALVGWFDTFAAVARLPRRSSRCSTAEPRRGVGPTARVRLLWLGLPLLSGSGGCCAPR